MCFTLRYPTKTTCLFPNPDYNVTLARYLPIQVIELQVMNCIKHSILLFIVTFGMVGVNSQIKVSEVIQESKIASDANNKLYFVDFWATWCAPCIHAKKLLTVVQEQFPTELYIVSLSEENPVRVERFLENKPTDLAVVMDFYGETFNAFNINEIPKGILFNAKGKQLWSGHPAELTPERIRGFLRQNRATSRLSDFLDIVKIDTTAEYEYIPSESLEIKPTNDATVDALTINDYSTHLKLKGSLKEIVSYLSRIYVGQVEASKSLNKNYEVYIKKPFSFDDNFGYKIIAQLGYGVEVSNSTKDAFELTLGDTKFWDTQQIDWGQNASKYLISDSELMADNVSLKDVAYQLSNALDVPVVISNEDKRSLALHDWQIHYKFFEFMKNNFEDYGITVQKKTFSIPKYSIIKKAP